MQVSLEQLNEVYKTVFGSEIQITELTTKNDIEKWDSISHLNLILELMHYFNTSFTVLEIERIKSIKDIMEILKMK